MEDAYETKIQKKKAKAKILQGNSILNLEIRGEIFLIWFQDASFDKHANWADSNEHKPFTYNFVKKPIDSVLKKHLEEEYHKK